MNRLIKFQGVDENNKLHDLIAINWGNMTGLCEVEGMIGTSWCLFKEFRQFTGLLDKNGKEIYEGDIVRLNRFSKNYKCVFSDGAFKVGDWIVTEANVYNKFFEVIGNRYEHPHLLPS